MSNHGKRKDRQPGGIPYHTPGPLLKGQYEVMNTDTRGEQDHGLWLFRDDPFVRFWRWLHLPATLGGCCGRILFVLLLTWCPLALLTGWRGHLWSEAAHQSFLMDFAAYAQFGITLPILLGIQSSIDKFFHRSERSLHTSVAQNLPQYEQLIVRLTKLRTAIYPEIICLALAFVFIGAWIGSELHDGIITWRIEESPQGNHLTPAGWWTLLISHPLFAFVWIRWAWKVFVWTLFLWNLSKVKLNIRAAHPDRAGGMGMLGHMQARLGILIFVFGLNLTATVIYKLVVEHASFATPAVASVILGYLVIAPILFVVPLLLFTGQLTKAKWDAMLQYTRLSSDYVTLFETKWLARRITEKDTEELAGDLEGISNLSGCYDDVVRMRVVPFDLKSLSQLVMSAISPLLPLFLKMIPWPEVQQLLEALK